MKKWIQHLSSCILLLAMALFLMPVTAQAVIDKTHEDIIRQSYLDPITNIDYAETSDGKIKVTLTVDYSVYRVSVNTLRYKTVFCSVENRTVTQEDVFCDVVNDNSGKYTLTKTFAPGSTVGFHAYYLSDYSDSMYDDDDVVSAATKYTYTMPVITKDPRKDIQTINQTDGVRKFSGTFVGARTQNIYKLNAASDAYLQVKNFKSSSSDGWIGLCYFDERVQKTSRSTSDCYDYIRTDDGDNITAGLAAGRSYYLILNGGGSKASWSFDIEFRKYRHAYVELAVEEGSLDGAFPQNTKLHFTATMKPANTDAYFDSDSYVNAPGYDNVKVTANGKKATFALTTGNSSNETTWTLHYKELNPENISEYYGTTGTGMQKDFLVTTGLSGIALSPEVGYNFIKFSNFNIPDYGASDAKITVSLKDGKKWKKKFTVKAFSKTTKTIKKLKPGTKYQYKVVISKTMSSGKKVKTTTKYKVKTGPKSAPSIKSIKASKVKQSTWWSSGWWDSGWHWHPGHWNKTTSFTLTITLKKAVKGAVAMEINGLRANGKGKKYTVSCSKSGYVKGKSFKYTVRAITSNEYGGYSKASKKISVKIK